VGEQHRSGRHDDEPLDKLGRNHADRRIDAHVADEVRSDARLAVFIGSNTRGDFFFDLFGGLPEEHVRRDRRAEHAGDDEEKGEAEFKVRD
jgi:hypothetical protein